MVVVMVMVMVVVMVVILLVVLVLADGTQVLLGARMAQVSGLSQGQELGGRLEGGRQGLVVNRLSAGADSVVVEGEVA